MAPWLRLLCFLACLPSGGALLLKVWGITSMAWGGTLFLACLPIFPLAYGWSRRHDASLARALRLGCWGGLLGTLGYDFVRVPFHLYGLRVFAPIQAYGVWLLDADRSSGATAAVGWLYHFSNGITFGLMYALLMGGRHWGWGILWGLTLESIVLASPFARIFHMQGNWPAIAVAYGAHVAFGYPLGYVVARWQEADERLASLPAAIKLSGAALLGGFIFGWMPGERARDARAAPSTMRVEGIGLNPTWLRLRAAGRVDMVNPGSEKVTILQPSGKRQLEVAAQSSQAWEFAQPGIYQCYVQTPNRSISSFVIVEPAEQCP